MPIERHKNGSKQSICYNFSNSLQYSTRENLMGAKKLKFETNTTQDELKEIYNFNVEAFADSQDFAWTEENLANEVKNGWKIISAKIDEDIVCALFMKKEEANLLTKNTPIKINHQGNGHSHTIKEFYEEYAKDNQLKSVYNYCPDDNFRMISLNEGHEYIRTGKTLDGNKKMIEWVKKLG